MNYIDWSLTIIIYLLSVGSIGYQYAHWRWNVWDNLGPYYSNIHRFAFPFTQNNYNESNLLARFRKEPHPYIFFVAFFWPFNIILNVMALFFKCFAVALWIAAVCLIGGLVKDNENVEED